MSNPLAPSLSPSLGNAALAANETSNVNTSMSDLLPKEPKAPKSAKTGAKSTNAKDGSKRRGPNSHRVRDMFASIGEERVPLDDIIKNHHVSVHVARQSKRFDPFQQERGQVVIKTLADDNGKKRAFIWRVKTGAAVEA